jgi:hypothetical protein
MLIFLKELTTKRNSIKIILFLIFSLNSYFTYPQKYEIEKELNWFAHTDYNYSLKKNLDQLKFNTVAYFDNEHILPSFFDQIYLGEGFEYELELTSTEFSEISEEAYQKLYKERVTDLDFILDYEINYYRKQPVINYRINALRLNPVTGKVEKLDKFNVTLTSKESGHLRDQHLRGYTENSVLASGNWVKICINQSGVYKLDFNYLNEIGLNPGSINPKNIKIYGNGGGMLPQPNSKERHDDLVENAIFVFGENDGKFDNSDYILFYAKGPHTWKHNEQLDYYKHQLNEYTDEACYFITLSDGAGKRIGSQQSISGTPVYETDEYDFFAFHEINRRTDITDYVKSGRDWFGEDFIFTTSRDFNFTSPDVIVSKGGKMMYAAGARSEYGKSLNLFQIKAGSSTLVDSYESTSSSYLGDYVVVNEKLFSFNPNSEQININLTYSKPTSTSSAWLNYISINTRNKIVFRGDQLIFRDKNVAGVNLSKINFKATLSKFEIWDVSNIFDIKKQEYVGSSNNYSFQISTDTINQYIIFEKGTGLTPKRFEKVENQNLHGLKDIDMVIVSHPNFMEQALRFKEFRSRKNGLEIVIVTPLQIYNEFSSGVQDVTAIRDFMKMLYDKASSPEKLPQYLLLFGDASYDLKNVLPNNTNFVPTYQSKTTYSPIESFATDDYFGFLDDNEGAFDKTGGLGQMIDIGIGRLPVSNTAQANAVLNKIINYENKETYGDWRNTIMFVADDVDDGGGNYHFNQSEVLSKYIYNNHEDLNIDKIYMDAYEQQTSPNGHKYPDATKAINQIMNKGALITNYIGHGGEAGWAHERVLEISDIKSWENFDKLSLFITATCEFSRYDDPERISAGEWCILHPNGGAVAMLTTSRVVYIGSNDRLGEQLYMNNIFKQPNGISKTFGQINLETKNRTGFGSDLNNTSKFILLGDPSQKLAYPENNVVVTKIPDTLKAMDLIELEGEIQDYYGNKLTDFNGVVNISVYDKASELKTLDNDNYGQVKDFSLQKSIIYKGTATVKNGEFKVEFVVPKDISYVEGTGKISFYAENGLIDANGFYDSIIIGGTNSNAINDNQPPTVRLFMGDTNFVFGGITDENPTMLALVKDDNGINTVGNGIGHELVGYLDDSDEPIILNDFYESYLDNFKEGQIVYPFSNLSEGRHKLRVKVWDVANNSAEAYTEFVVVNSRKPQINQLKNYPNPAGTYTIFSFEHNRPNEELFISIDIFDISGKLVKRIEENIYSEGNTVNNIQWNLVNDFGDNVIDGVFLYRLILKTSDGKLAQKSSKMIIIR